MAAPLLTLCPHNVPAAVSVEIPKGEFVTAGDPFYRNRASVYARLSLVFGEPNLELSFNKSNVEAGHASTKFPLALCGSIEFKHGLLYGKGSEAGVTEKLKFWTEDTYVRIPERKNENDHRLQYLAISLTDVPELKWDKRDLNGSYGDTGPVWTSLGPDCGRTEILVIYNIQDELTRMNGMAIEAFRRRCEELQTLKLAQSQPHNASASAARPTESRGEAGREHRDAFGHMGALSDSAPPAQGVKRKNDASSHQPPRETSAEAAKGREQDGSMRMKDFGPTFTLDPDGNIVVISDDEGRKKQSPNKRQRTSGSDSSKKEELGDSNQKKDGSDSNKQKVEEEKKKGKSAVRAMKGEIRNMRSLIKGFRSRMSDAEYAKIEKSLNGMSRLTNEVEDKQRDEREGWKHRDEKEE